METDDSNNLTLLSYTKHGTSTEFTCTDCKDGFSSAAQLLKHFAAHASSNHTVTSSKTDLNDKKRIPDLFPIKAKINEGQNESDVSSDSGLEDMNPLKFCLVTMEEQVSSKNLKKYQCSYCLKRFGWSTDLKRHILIHTGERPFQCEKCDLNFTRKFLLQKHERKVHSVGTVRAKIPELKPITQIMKKC